MRKDVFYSLMTQNAPCSVECRENVLICTEVYKSKSNSLVEDTMTGKAFILDQISRSATELRNF